VCSEISKSQNLAQPTFPSSFGALLGYFFILNIRKKWKLPMRVHYPFFKYGCCGSILKKSSTILSYILFLLFGGMMLNVFLQSRKFRPKHRSKIILDDNSLNQLSLADSVVETNILRNPVIKKLSLSLIDNEKSQLNEVIRTSHYHSKSLRHSLSTPSSFLSFSRSFSSTSSISASSLSSASPSSSAFSSFFSSFTNNDPPDNLESIGKSFLSLIPLIEHYTSPEYQQETFQHPKDRSFFSTAMVPTNDRILCVTFLTWKDSHSNLAKNILYSHHFCEWIICIYDTAGLKEEEMKKQLQYSLSIEKEKILQEVQTKRNRLLQTILMKDNDYELMIAPSRVNQLQNYKKVCENYFYDLLKIDSLLNHNKLNKFFSSVFSSSSSSSSSTSPFKTTDEDLYDETEQQHQGNEEKKKTKEKEGILSFCSLIEPEKEENNHPSNNNNNEGNSGQNPKTPFVSYHPSYVNHRIYPKTQLLIMLLTKLYQYDYVWLLDNDILLDDFDFAQFIKLHSCSFKKKRPLVSQPLLREKKKNYQYLSTTSWNNKNPDTLPSSSSSSSSTAAAATAATASSSSTSSSSVSLSSSSSSSSSPYVAASTVGFVEIQIPFINTVYLQWFILSYIIPMFQPMNILGADWGFDDLFCKSGELFLSYDNIPIQSHHHHRRESSDFAFTASSPSASSSSSSSSSSSPYYLFEQYILGPIGYAGYLSEEPSHIPCAVFPGSSSIHHQDNGEIQSTMGGEELRIVLNQKLRKIIQNTFPNYVVEGSEKDVDPLLSKSNHYVVYESQLNC
jgi:hypothetical protein